MDAARFTQLVDRLERQSAAAPGAYRLKVAALTLLGFGILACLLGTIGLGLLLLVGAGVAMLFSGGAALILLLKLGKLLFLLAVPMWFLVRAGAKALFVRLPRPEGREIARSDAPALFAAMDDLRRRMRGPAFHHVLIVDELNAAVVQRPAFGLFGWPRNYLLLGLPLLECMPPAEALAVVAHEYGHLAGAHSRFSGFVYRQRLAWATLLAHTETIPGWLGRLIAPMMRWYVPYFNAYTFVLARAHEYQADAASAELVGRDPAMNALKRINVAGSQHRQFLAQAFERVVDEPVPPSDLMRRWADEARREPAPADAARWMDDALDRRGHFADSHPSLRARLGALALQGAVLQALPPQIDGVSAAEAWLGPALDRLRIESQAAWAKRATEPWSERHAAWQRQRERLAELRAIATPDADQQIECLALRLRLEPDVDVREDLAAFNAAHADHALGLFIEAGARLDRGDRSALALIDRVIELDPEATRAACERAFEFLMEQRDPTAAEAYAERYRSSRTR